MLSHILLTASALLAVTYGNPLEASARNQIEVDAGFEAALVKRALANAPDGYTPSDVNCPSEQPAIRRAGSLSQQEISWLQMRRANTVAPMRDLLGRMGITGLDTNAYIDNHKSNVANLPNIGVAMSGGGYRALLNGAGVLAAFDSRTANSTSRGHLGGLLQSTTYLSGLSGGSWLIGSLYVNNFTAVQDILATPAHKSATGGLWQFSRNLLQGPQNGVRNTGKYFIDLWSGVQSKENKGFNTTITDYWGRALSYQLINATAGGPAYTWSSISKTPSFTDGSVPMPIIVADGRAPGETLISLNATVFEFNPWEMGSHDPMLYGFAPLAYVGSNFSAGVLGNKDKCIAGFDNAGYIMGTSSSLFNQFLLNVGSVSGIPSVVKTALAKILGRIGKNEEDIADWSPNPFLGWNTQKNPGAKSRSLTLVDGGEDLQNIPLHPLIQPERSVDVIFAVDSSADTLGAGANWPNGTAIVATYARSMNPTVQNGTAFPAIPDQNTIVNLGLNKRPTFFGCDTKNMTGPAPIIVYLPNAPYIFNSNISTFAVGYNTSTRNAMVQNGYLVATMGNGTLDANWPACVGCAVLSRSLERTKTKAPDICTKCFKEYCWDGTVKAETPAKSYQPELIMPTFKAKHSSAVGSAVVSSGLLLLSGLVSFFALI
ncbi:hypothetical protein FKW77_008448 [Venturia effusa]|uniref:Lysophospholipase n=1 Tax=Venturia effusa TaxID=50376 RepID=A0A517L9S6_9PEZI|nr:hypothetical protein FKW77_008448 [Venturia effusa]